MKFFLPCLLLLTSLMSDLYAKMAPEEESTPIAMEVENVGEVDMPKEGRLRSGAVDLGKPQKYQYKKYQEYKKAKAAAQAKNK